MKLIKSFLISLILLFYCLNLYSQTTQRVDTIPLSRLRSLARRVDSIRNQSYKNEDDLFVIFTKMARDSALLKDSGRFFFIHVKPLEFEIILGDPTFQIAYKSDSLNWISQELHPIDKDSLGYLLKVRIPSTIWAKHEMLSCFAIWWTIIRRISMVYGGVDSDGIQLLLQSKPEKASVYLIPKRVWEDKYDKENWQKRGLSVDYLVDNDQTNTSVIIDETKYIVVFKLGNKYLVRVHKTASKDVAPIQKVSVDFKNE